MLQATTVRTQRFGSGAVILRAHDANGLSDADIMARAPAVFAEEKHESRSERFTYIPTRELLAGLRQNGLVPFEVRQGGSRDEIKRGYTKHMLRLRRAAETLEVGGLIPEVILLNSHDGTSAYKMDAGIFRTICTNGLIVGESFIEAISIPHRGDVMGQVIEGAYRVLNEVPRAIDAAQQMQAIALSPPEQVAFARAAAELRFEPLAAQPDPADLNRARRYGDNGADLWSTFNRVQETIIRGGAPYVHTDQRGRRHNRSSRPVRSIDGDRGINRALWTLAEEMRRLKQAA